MKALQMDWPMVGLHNLSGQLVSQNQFDLYIRFGYLSDLPSLAGLERPDWSVMYNSFGWMVLHNQFGHYYNRFDWLLVLNSMVGYHSLFDWLQVQHNWFDQLLQYLLAENYRLMDWSEFDNWFDWNNLFGWKVLWNLVLDNLAGLFDLCTNLKSAKQFTCKEHYPVPRLRLRKTL